PQSPGSRRQHRVDAARGSGAGSHRAAGALGAGEGRPRTGGAAQWGSGDWQVASGTGAARPRGGRAAGVADAVSVLPLSPEHGLVSPDRPAGTGGAALGAGGVAPAKAAQTGGLPGAVWPATGRGGAPPGGPPVAAAAGGRCTAGWVV